LDELELAEAPNRLDQTSRTITENTQKTTDKKIQSENTISRLKEALPAPASPSAFSGLKSQSSVVELVQVTDSNSARGLTVESILEKTKPAKSYVLVDSDAASQVFNDWREVMEYPEAVFNNKYRISIASRLKEGYSVADLKLAIRGVLFSPWHMGKNEAKMVYDDIELICRDGTKVEKFKKLALSNSIGPDTPMTKSVKDKPEPYCGFVPKRVL
jgi:hypothetical protein